MKLTALSAASHGNGSLGSPASCAMPHAAAHRAAAYARCSTDTIGAHARLSAVEQPRWATQDQPRRPARTGLAGCVTEPTSPAAELPRESASVLIKELFQNPGP